MAQRDVTERPISPHLQIYRPMLTMMMSITHRLTGAGLYVASALFAWWLIALASGPAAYGTFRDLAGSPFGLIVLVAITWTLIHHMLGGVRHLIWDTGRGFDLGTVELMARLNLAGSIVLTAAVWAAAFWLGVV